MPRHARQCPGGYVYHVWNRAAGRLRLFKKDKDYAAFERIMVLAGEKCPIRILDWCLMPNHWHFVAYPLADGQVTAFFRWLTHTHAMRAITHRRVLGMGPLYQGRFKSLPVQRDEHLATLLRYVQRNPLRANLVRRSGDWRHTGEWARRHGPEALRGLLSDWPIDRRRGWAEGVDGPQTATEVEALREHIGRGRPYGSTARMKQTAAKLNLEHSLRPRGRPKQEKT